VSTTPHARVDAHAESCEPVIELLICTRNRSRQLEKCLDSLRHLNPGPPWALVVVDNASTDDTAERVRRFASSATFEVRYVREDKIGVGNARNAALKAARAEVLAFTDDDCYPQPDFLERVFDCFSEDPEIAFLGGRILLHDAADAPVTIQLRSERIRIAARSFVPAGLIHGANLSIRRSRVIAVGGFDPWFGTGSLFPAEDVELIARLSAAGWTGVYDPRPVVSHHHGRKQEDLAQLWEAYDRGRGAYYAKCLLNSQISLVYLRNWYWSIRRSKLNQSWPELRSAIEYFWRELWDRRRRFDVLQEDRPLTDA